MTQSTGAGPTGPEIDLVRGTATHDPVAAHTGVVTESSHAALRADIRLLGDLFGETLVAEHGQDVLDLVAFVRQLARHSGGEEQTLDDDAALAGLLAGLDTGQATVLARAFATFFALTNVAEQLHRSRELDAYRRDHGGPLRATVSRLRAQPAAAEAAVELFNHLELRPVFTAHPTEASRQTVLHHLGKIAAVLADRLAAGSTARGDASAENALRASIDLLWQTDELRVGKPTPNDEARAIAYYLDQLTRAVLPDLLDDLRENSPRSAWTFRPRRCRSGSAAGSAAIGTATRK